MNFRIQVQSSGKRLTDKTEFGGKALVYLQKCVPPDDELFEKIDTEIEEIFLNALKKCVHISNVKMLSRLKFRASDKVFLFRL